MSDFLDNVLFRSSAPSLHIAPRPISRFEPLAAGAMLDIAAPNNDRDRDDAEQLTAEATDFMPTSRLQRQSSQPSFSQPPLLQPERTLRLDSLRVAPIQPEPKAELESAQSAQGASVRIAPIQSEHPLSRDAGLIGSSQPQIDSRARAAIQPAVVTELDKDQHAPRKQPGIAYQPAKHPIDHAPVATNPSERTNRAPPLHSLNQVLPDPMPHVAEPPAPSVDSPQHSPTASPNVSVTPLVETHSERVIIERVVPAERGLNTERDQPPMPVLLPAPPVSTTSRALAVAPAASDPAVPSITVTIGRIEVRALPPAPAPTQRQRSTPPVLSLDDYLRQRNGSTP